MSSPDAFRPQTNTPKSQASQSLSIQQLIGTASEGQDLSAESMAWAVDGMMRDQWSAAEIGLLLMALRAKGEAASEIVGAATAMRGHMTPIACTHPTFIDTCGTGGDGSCTFNISTAAALVTAAAGLPVAKHGNRRASSLSGSADVLAALGVGVEAGVPTVEHCLAELKICFCFAPLLHGAMRHVAEVRRQLGVPTLFNLLGPLTNPAGAPYQLLGVGRAEVRPLLAKALVRLGTRRSVLVTGADGLDEVTLAAETHVSLAEPAGVREFVWTPEEFGLQRQTLAGVQIDSPEASAQMIRSVLSGTTGTARDLVVINSAAALWTAGSESSPRACAEQAAEAIDSGRAAALLARLVELTN